MGYLDNAGLSRFWEAIKKRSLPLKGMTQAEYDALSEEEKRNGTLYMTSEAAFDGGSSPVPTGAVLSFLVRNAPYGYLICDGKEHPIAMYPRLAQYIREQFGETSHFGGDGETTFAVPDMRNLFLRGYHGESEEQLSGDIGAVQPATQHIWTEMDTSGHFTIGGPANLLHITENCDTVKDVGGYTAYNRSNATSNSNRPGHFTSRPVNMAVLLCIKT